MQGRVIGRIDGAGETLTALPSQIAGNGRPTRIALNVCLEFDVSLSSNLAHGTGTCVDRAGPV